MSEHDEKEPVYIYIGQRIRERRKLLKLNQADLSELMGFSYQQMQKYETGASQVSAGKLLMFAKILNVPPSYFFEGLNLEESIGLRIQSHFIQKVRTQVFRVLLVEDNSADVILFKKAIDSQVEKVDLHALHDSEQVMDYLQHHEAKFGKKKPDIVILDLSMPKLGGMEILRSIKKHPKTMDIPAIILSNSINVKDMMDSYKNGAAGFIQKSVDLEEYMDNVKTVIKYWSKTVALPAA